VALRIGDIVDGKYQITDVLGEGGMGTVFAGVHRKIHRKVAIKVLKAGLADSDVMVRRFEREAQAAGRIGSRHIVEVHDVGELPSGERYMIMEYLSGESMSGHLRRVKRMLPETVFPLACQLLEGLDAAHVAGIVHRDLKPANVFLVDDRKGFDTFVKIVDFGISKFRHLSEGEGVTRTGSIVGTPHYMAPEQTKGARHASSASDIYAVGAIIYRALAGRPPYRGETIHEILVQLISEQPPQLGDLVPGIEPAVARIVHTALSRDPADRYASALEFRQALIRWLETHGIEVEARSSVASLDEAILRSGDQPAVIIAPDSLGDEEMATVPTGPSAPGIVASVNPPTLSTAVSSMSQTTIKHLRRNARIGMAIGAAGLVIALAIALPAAFSGDGATDGKPTEPAASLGAGSAEPIVADAADSSEAARSVDVAEPVPSAQPSASATSESSVPDPPHPVVTSRRQKRRRPPPPPPRPPPPPKDEREIREDL
jgi:serine/threonine protein kinase